MTDISKYQNAVIYKITNNKNSETYIGSTTMDLETRLIKHKCDAKTRPHLSKFYKFMNEQGVDDFDIDVVEEFPCESKEQLEKREGEIIREMGTLNQRIAGRTNKEYMKEFEEYFREYKKQYKKQWRLDNREHYLEKERGYKKTYREKYKDKIQEKTSAKVECECGGTYTLGHKAEHMKSKKHLKLMGAFNEEEYKQSKRAEQIKKQYEKNKDKIDKEAMAEYKKNWYENKRDEILEKKKQYHQEHKEERNKKNKQYREEHKEEEKARRGRKCECQCGKTYTFGNRQRHFNSNHHQQYLQQQEQEN